MEDENDKTLKNNNYEEPNYSIGIVEQKEFYKKNIKKE